PRRRPKVITFEDSRRSPLSRRRGRVGTPARDGPLERTLEIDRLQSAGPVAQRFEVWLRRLDGGATRQAAATAWSKLQPALPRAALARTSQRAREVDVPVGVSDLRGELVDHGAHISEEWLRACQLRSRYQKHRLSEASRTGRAIARVVPDRGLHGKSFGFSPLPTSQPHRSS